MSIRPAYHIPLSVTQLRQIGELCAIQAQIEWCMQITVKKLLDISIETMLKVMASTSIRINSVTWISVVREKLGDPEGLAWAEHAYAQIEKLSEGRNDFVHALYGIDLLDVFPDPASNFFMVTQQGRKSVHSLLKQSSSAAIRLRNHAPSKLEKLPDLLKQAAHVSLIAAYILDLSPPVAKDALSSWRRRLGSRLPPEPPKAQPKKGKGRQGPPQSSPP